MRKNFTPSIVKKIATNAMYICSNPYCLKFTGYSTTEGKTRSIAESAHINAASQNGPRSSQTDEDYLESEKNGIWLCKICHDKVDDDTSFYTENVLKEWKKNHESVIRNIVGKDLESALLNLRNHKRYHDEIRELISFLESKRVIYEGLDQEFPPRVLESLNTIRERIANTRAKINPDIDLFLVLNKLQEVINKFLNKMELEVNLNTLRCDSSDEKWIFFADELLKLRSGLMIIIKPLADNSDYKLSWFEQS